MSILHVILPNNISKYSFVNTWKISQWNNFAEKIKAKRVIKEKKKRESSEPCKDELIVQEMS